MSSFYPTAPQLQIDLSAIAANYTYMKSLAAHGAEIAAVVKSDAYGLGLDLVVPALLDAGCNRVFVKDLREGLHVRKRLSSSAMIHVLSGFEPRDIDDYIGSRLDPVCRTLSQALASLDRLPQFLLAVDTGFSRFGLPLSELALLVHRTSRRPDLLVSHLACADARANETNALQRDRFAAACEILQPCKRSLAASAAIWLGPRFHFDVVRVGSALFGLNNAAIEPCPLQPVVRLTARIVDVRTVHRGESVGYAASFRASRQMCIGIIALGYVQGLPWSAGNAISAAIGSHIAPIVGRIAMEYTAIDLTELPRSICVPGTAVELLGPRMSVDAMATATGTIPQELLVRLGSGCRRQYACSPSATAGEPH
ncbi:hypothetical protein ASE04_18610 [Rhizobium sp. Root708]|uniref:alanine racemase n=1 Tax=Rhizobium sp. Root708 TaxID=1736592 RepID=UPI0006F4BD75|nr:alanine racemase [Rhizobium sp. Root708]KRB49191.1 hypothetical protein ASE04_18610 [Rhizobium sp. Root708]